MLAVYRAKGSAINIIGRLGKHLHTFRVQSKIIILGDNNINCINETSDNTNHVIEALGPRQIKRIIQKKSCKSKNGSSTVKTILQVPTQISSWGNSDHCLAKWTWKFKKSFETWLLSVFNKLIMRGYEFGWRFFSNWCMICDYFRTLQYVSVFPLCKRIWLFCHKWAETLCRNKLLNQTVLLWNALLRGVKCLWCAQNAHVSSERQRKSKRSGYKI